LGRQATVTGLPYFYLSSDGAPPRPATTARRRRRHRRWSRQSAAV